MKGSPGLLRALTLSPCRIPAEFADEAHLSLSMGLFRPVYPKGPKVHMEYLRNRKDGLG